MTDPYEQKRVIGYLRNLLQQPGFSQAALDEICGALECSPAFFGLPENDDTFFELLDEFRRAFHDKQGSRKLRLRTQQAIVARLSEREKDVAAAVESKLERILHPLVAEMRLSALEAQFLELLVHYRLCDPLYSLLNELTRLNMGIVEVCASALGSRPAELRKVLTPSGHLMSAGLLRLPTRHGKDIDDHYDVPDLLLTALQKSLVSDEDLKTHLLGRPARAHHEWQDFEHLGPVRDKLATFIRSAVSRQASGINILLYGPPGTGKTEFCKTLAAELGLDLYALAEADEEGAEPNRKERLAGFQLAQNLLRYQGGSLLLFDEMDDLFEFPGLARLFGGKLQAGSKVFINRLFENNPVPTIWTINEASCLDESIIRRMSLAVEMKIPSQRSRQRVWKRQLDRQNISLPETDLEKLAQSEVSPAIVQNAIRFAEFSAGGMDDFQFATQSLIRAMKGPAALKTAAPSEGYDPDLVVADCDLDTLATNLSCAERKDFSLCLYGPPGTGKSAYIRFLARKMGMPVLQKRASDLLSKWVGESEQQIAEAFAEALQNESFLVFDEADSLLRDRRFARAGWEVSQVNEMLTWMEQHPLPFACTTNLKEHLDAASMRRFTFKTHLDYLGQQEVCRAFERFFGLSLDARQAGSLRNLTPGDFVVVKKKVRYLGCGKDVTTLVELLQQEVEAKNELSAVSPIGFHAVG